MVDSALERLVAVYNGVQNHYFDSTAFFDTDSNPGGSLSLLRKLRLGIEAEKDWLARIRAGEVPGDEWRQFDI